jgi:hypothetical protein
MCVFLTSLKIIQPFVPLAKPKATASCNYALAARQPWLFLRPVSQRRHAIMPSDFYLPFALPSSAVAQMALPTPETSPTRTPQLK